MTKALNYQKLILDGGFGSYLLDKGILNVGQLPERLNLSAPELITDIHKEYVAAGADVVYANTFGANRFKYGHAELKNVIVAGLKAARASGAKAVALDIGSLGKIIGQGGISRAEAYDAFSEIILIGAPYADLVVIETMQSMAEVRTAILAAKENCNLPIFATISCEKNGRTFFGTSIESFAVAATALGVTALGANCSVGPKEMVGLVEKIKNYTDLPIIIKPNAGLPHLSCGVTRYDLNDVEFAEAMKDVFCAGANIIGGCCGTTPDYIKAMVKATANLNQVERPKVSNAIVASSNKVVPLDGYLVVGERINPTGKPKFKAALAAGDIDFVVDVALKEDNEGADILDVNVGLNGIDEKATMVAVVEAVQRIVNRPLMIDSSDPIVIEAALRAYDGKAIINSVNGTDESMSKIFPIAKKYGAALIGLTLDYTIYKTVAERIAVAERIISKAKSFGISEENLIIDALTLSESSERGNALTTLNIVKELTSKKIKTILGISNISFGMPNREDLNAAFLSMSNNCGLTLAIVDPSKSAFSGSKYAFDFLNNTHDSLEAYMDYQNVAPVYQPKPDIEIGLIDAIVSGQADTAARLARNMRKDVGLTEIVAQYIMPALDEVGGYYENGRLFLPQLIAASEAAKAVFAEIDDIDGAVSENKPKFVLATVKGDIHDIGKNIVKSVVKNYGFNVIDLGKDVDYDRILDAVRANYPCCLGLSALMTTTAKNMQHTIKLVKDEFAEIKVLVGGAVITPEYADSIGGIYCKDAADTVKKLKEIFS